MHGAGGLRVPDPSRVAGHALQRLTACCPPARPLRRVTPQGGAPVEGPTALKAWQALYACDAAGAARSLGLSGELMFGLALPRMQRAIQALPGAARCDRYCSWAEGQQPEAVPLVRRWPVLGAAGGCAAPACCPCTCGGARPRPARPVPPG